MRAFCIVAACLATISCQRIAGTAGPLPFEPTRFADAIPAEYGTLVGVTQNVANPDWVGLWFQGEDKTITAVFVNVVERRMSDGVLTIPRK